MKRLLFSTVMMVVLLLSGCQIAQPKSAEGVLSGALFNVQFLDVGQGDSIFLQSPEGKTMLVDAGTKGAGRNIANYLQGLGIKKIDYVVATHPDADHIGGLVPILEQFEVGTFVDSGKPHTSQTFIDMLTLIDNKSITYYVPATGDEWSLGDAKVEVLHANENAKDNNDASIVLRVLYDEVSFLLTGDAGISLEKEMMKSDVKSTVLKAGHHGSNTSSSPQFIQAVQPEIAILSYGEGNKYGHPHDEVMDVLAQQNVKVYATATQGNIIVETDGKHYKVGAVPLEMIALQSATGVILQSKDVVKEEVVIANTSNEAVSLEDWQLVSVEGNQIFTFPSVTLQAGDTITVTSGTDAMEDKTHIKWTNQQIWLNSGDAAQLKDAKGVVVSELD